MGYHTDSPESIGSYFQEKENCEEEIVVVVS
jgi:hypothetical protein